MKARTPLAFFVLAIAVTSRPSFAQSDEPQGGEPRPSNEVVAIDFEALPKGKLPALPSANEAPLGVPKWSQVPSFKVTPVVDAPEGQRAHARRPVKIIRRKKRPGRDGVTIVDVALTSPTVDALYLSSAESDDFSADTTLRLPCGKSESVSSMRWETLVTTPDGNTHLDVRDLWFDGKTCAVGAGPTASVPLKAVAWHKGKPWLYAMRSEGAVTFILARVDNLTYDAMAGSTAAVRGDFTRIAVPIGRWGSAQINANVSALTRIDEGHAAEGAESRAAEIGIDIVQTMAEKSPTLLVRVHHAGAAASDDSES